MEILNKINENIEYYDENIVMFDTIPDGSSILHALLMSISKEYKMNKINRKDMVKNLRDNLSTKLSTSGTPYTFSNGKQSTYYEELSGGRYKKLSKNIKKLSLENMMAELKSNAYIDDIYIEYISNVLNHDIYIFDYNIMDIKIIGIKYEYLYKGRKSVCIIKKDRYYKLLGLADNTGTIRTNYESEDEFVKMLNDRINIRYTTQK